MRHCAGVAAFRGVAVEHVLERFGQGGPISGRDALAVGMIDELGTLEAAIAGLRKSSGPRLGTTAPARSLPPAPPLQAENRPMPPNRLAAEGGLLPPAASLEDVCRQRWNSDPAIRAEFRELGALIAYECVAAHSRSMNASAIGLPPGSGPHAEERPLGPSPATDAYAAEYAADPALQAEFGPMGGLSAYSAFRRASEKGLVKILRRRRSA